MGKGRDSELIKLRDEALCRRYYFWTEVQSMRFDRALKILSEQEFFISEERILAIIRKAKYTTTRSDQITLPRNKQPRLTYKQLALFSDDADMAIARIHRDSRNGN